MIKFKMEAILVGTNELVNRRKICSAFKSMDMRNAVTTLVLIIYEKVNQD